jgi:hypothetical protein
MERSLVATIKNITLLVSTFVALYASRSMSDGSLDGVEVALTVWVISPYLAFFLLTYFLERYTSVKQLPGIALVISLLVLALTTFAYLTVAFGDHRSSTEGLIFIFLPLWLLIGSFGLLGVALLVVWLSRRYPEGS